MKYLSIIEKMRILGEMLLNYKIVGILTVLMIILTVLYLVKVLNKKKYMIVMMLAIVMMFAISIITNLGALSKTFDNFMNIFFKNIYFPSIYSYIFMMAAIFGCFVVSILSRMLRKSYKVINSVMFVINNIYTAILLNEIAKSKIDVFSPLSLYTNNNLVAILELNVGTFILWIFCLVVVYTTNVICERIEGRQNVKTVVETATKEEEETVISPSDVFDNNLVTVSLNENNNEPLEATLMPSLEKIEEPLPLEDNSTIIPEVNYEDNTKVVTLNDILSGNIPVVECDSVINNNEYEVINPEEIYENKYNEALDKINNEASLQEVISAGIDEKEREQSIKEKLDINTILLSELEDEKDKEESKIETIDSGTASDTISGYTVEQYKTFIKMLKQLKIHTGTDNVNVSDAVAISLMNNYSYDDCIMFKRLLESNLK